MKVFAYTFRTSSFQDYLAESFGSVFVFGKMREDFERLKLELKDQRPNLIIGFASSWNKYSYIESRALNRFNKTNVIERNGLTEFSLFLPSIPKGQFKLNSKGSDSFCNWAMYRISSFIEAEKFDSKHAFFHCHATDLDCIASAITMSNN